MTRLVWDSEADRYFRGVDRGCLYPKDRSGMVWNGLTQISETTESNSSFVIYIDGRKQINNLDLGYFSATIKAISYPLEGYALIQERSIKIPFGLSYRTMIDDVNYKLHIVYNCIAKPTEEDHESLDSDGSILEMSWDVTTKPVVLPYGRPSSHFYLDSRSVYTEALSQLEDILYGTDFDDPRLPTVAEIFSIFEENAIFVVSDNGDNTATVTGPDGWVDQDQTDDTEYTLTSPSIVQEDSVTYFAASY